MKRLFLIVLTSINLFSCKKNTIHVSSLGSLTVTNVIVNGKNIRMSNYLRDSILINDFKQLSLKAGSNSIYLFPSTDSLKPYYNNTLIGNDGVLYSLFLTGSVSAIIEPVLIKETTLPWYTDSICAVRFANMSPDNIPIKVTLTATPGTVEFASLAYKGISDFKSYPAKITNGTYSLDIRNASTDGVLATYNLTTPRFHAVTLVWKGIAGGTGNNAQGILRVNNY